MCSHRKGSRELRTLSLSVGRALCCLHSGKDTAQCVWYPWCSCTAPECLAHWAGSRRQMLQYSFQLCRVLCQGPAVCACRSSCIFVPHLRCVLWRAKWKTLTCLLDFVQQWYPRHSLGVYPRCQLIALDSRTSLDPRSSLCSQAFTPISTWGTTW